MNKFSKTNLLPIFIFAFIIDSCSYPEMVRNELVYENDFESFDLIFVMDSSNHRNVLKYAKSEKERQKVNLILDYPGSKTKEVPDPYYGGDKGFESVFKLIDAGCDYHSQRLIKTI